MQHDEELSSILQDARESYQRRIDELKNSFKPFSTHSNESLLDLEKFSPFKSTFPNSDSLKYSASVKPNTTPATEDYSNSVIKLNESGFQTFNPRQVGGKNQGFQNTNEELVQEVSNLRRQVGNMEENMERWKKSCKDAEDANNELRSRLREATMNVKKLSEEVAKSKDFRNESSFKELQSVKLHYKQKIGRIKEEMIKKDSEKQTVYNEMAILRTREKELKAVFEAQVKEICEEYANNLKAAGMIHNDELAKVKEAYEALSTNHSNTLIEETNAFRLAIKDLEKTNKAYKERLEKLIFAKESSEKHLLEKEKQVSELQLSLQKMKNEFENRIRHDKDSYQNELQHKIQKVKNELETRIRQSYEENNAKNAVLAKQKEDLDVQVALLSKAKVEMSVSYESEKLRSAAFESKLLRSESINRELQANNEALAHKAKVLEGQISQQSVDFQKKHDADLAKYNEKMKMLEKELKKLYLANGEQAKEMESLKILCAEIEVRQEEELKKVKEKHEHNLREVKKIDRYEFLQLSDTCESLKENVKQSGIQIEGYKSEIRSYQVKEKEYLALIQSLEENQKGYTGHLSKLKRVNSALKKTQNSAKVICNEKVNKLRSDLISYSKQIQDNQADFKTFQQNCFLQILKAVNFSISSLSRNKTYKSTQEKILISDDLTKAYDKIGLLENALQKMHISLRELEDENISLTKIIDERDPEKSKLIYQSAVRQVLSQVNRLEEEIEKSYDDLARTVRSLTVPGEVSEELPAKYRNLLEQSKKSIEYYMDRLVKLENEKAFDLNKSQSELSSLQKRLSQVLEDIRDVRD
jgi:chromosome segregation ATPase